MKANNTGCICLAFCKWLEHLLNPNNYYQLLVNLKSSVSKHIKKFIRDPLY